MKFFDKNLLIESKAGKKVYDAVKDMPIIDYHCHLSPEAIHSNAPLGDIGELWLAADHYKWRAMRICGVDEEYITGNKTFKEKFLKYAEILPLLAGGPLYYWSHMELKAIFGVDKPLNKDTAEEIYEQANAVLKNLRVWDMFQKFGVEYVATTDDPVDDLAFHGNYAGTTVRPTFRPDKVYACSDEYLSLLGKAAGVEIQTLDDLLSALSLRLDHFQSKGCKISDHGFERFPGRYATKAEASELFARKNTLTSDEKDALFGFLLVWLTKEYHRRGMLMQLHFAVIRNVNPAGFKNIGADSGFDLIGGAQPVQGLVNFFAQVPDDERPETVIYTLNDENLTSLVAVTGAFRHVRAGAAWWFNDTVEGIKRNLKVVAEYSAIGTNFGMLTDSRSFASYVRFDFFRRILSSYLGGFVDRGEYTLSEAITLAKRVCYNNIKEVIEK